MNGTMGKLLILANYIFLIYGSDIYEKRRHVHVTYNHRGFKKACKLWLEPEIELDINKVGDFKSHELNEIRDLIIGNKDILMKQLDLFYANQQVRAIRK
jgi:Domain of unknown function (DUF4160)